MMLKWNWPHWIKTFQLKLTRKILRKQINSNKNQQFNFLIASFWKSLSFEKIKKRKKKLKPKKEQKKRLKKRKSLGTYCE